jgi:hypothetical protein
MDSKSLNNTQVNSDFYKLQQDYNSLKKLFVSITDRNRFNENKIDHINQKLTESLENMSDALSLYRRLEVHFRKPKAAIMLGKRAEDLIGKMPG